MKKLRVCLLLSFAGLLAGCGATMGASDGAGYAALHPNAQTRAFIFANDQPFTREVAAHNLQCRKDPLCRK